MANTIQETGTGTYIILGNKFVQDFTRTTNISGSASLAATFLVPVGPAWTAVDTGSVTNPGTICLDNPAGPGIIQWASSSNATQSISTTYPGEWSKFSVTASNVSNGTYPLYARAVDTASWVSVIMVPR